MAAAALVLGATGSVGGGVARELLARGRPVRALARDPAKARAALGAHGALEIVAGDVQDRAAVARAAAGCGLVVHAVNYPYHRWVPHMETATASVLAAAREVGATVLFPGNVYGLGRGGAAPLAEDAPDAPVSRKGAVRVRLERALREAARDGAVRVLVLRAGDYFGPTVRNGLVDPLFGAAARGRAMRALGRVDLPHQWAYVPDLARAAVDLLDAAGRLAPCEVVHFAGHVVPTREMAALAAREAGHPRLALRVAPMWLLRGLGLVDPVVRELWEMRYLFESSVVLDGARLGRLLPAYRDTPLADAVRATVASYREGARAA
jgi:nucleoside-diphosphate-sugar epimerase